MTAQCKRQLTPVPFTQVMLNDPFWAPRQETNRTVTLPHMYRMLEESGRLKALTLDFERDVPSDVRLIFGDSDPAKWAEGASYVLAQHDDPELAKMLDDVVELIVQAQQPDGYLNSHFTAIQPDMRWKNLCDWHEMYCAGHLMEAAVAHHQATGDRKLLDALCRYADLIDQLFGPNPEQRPGYPGHPELELALVRLYQETGEKRYLTLSKFFVEERGNIDPHYFDQEAIERGDDPKDFWAETYEYCQARAPIREQDKVVGHAVRVMYLMAGVADLAHEYEDRSLLDISEAQWHNLIYQRMYLTGGIGPSKHNEGFTFDYDLPDETAYAETCAAIALVMWNHRLLHFEGDGKYADIIERTLYNGFISGLSLDGKHFFYVNPLASAGDHHREEWFHCPCCPPNVGRALASLGNHVYSTSTDGLWVHFYAQNQAEITIDAQPYQIELTSDYPWDGNISLRLSTEKATSFALHLRIPDWCADWQVRVNGADVSGLAINKGYIALERVWQSGDVIDLNLAMPIQTIWAHPAVRQMQGRLAIQRGPIIYCLEGVDHPIRNLDRVRISPEQVNQFSATHEAKFLGGVTVLTGQGTVIDETGWDETSLYQAQSEPTYQPIDIKAIPYAVWDNREAGEMRVWIRA